MAIFIFRVRLAVLQGYRSTMSQKRYLRVHGDKERQPKRNGGKLNLTIHRYYG